jgi:hypothetical protein
MRFEYFGSVIASYRSNIQDLLKIFLLTKNDAKMSVSMLSNKSKELDIGKNIKPPHGWFYVYGLFKVT